MQKFFTIVLCFFTVFFSKAQSFQEISTGAGYNKQSFIKLNDGSQKQVNNDAWDLAFTAFGFQDAGIFINESSGSSMGQNLPLTELYYALTDDFGAAIDLEAIKDYKYLNSEASWNFGAFNEVRDTLNPYDFGWGVYQPASNRVIGNKVYVLKLRNGEYRKIKIESLTGTTYTFRYAKLDGSGEVTKTLNKLTDNKGQKLIFFSFTTNETVDVLPSGGFDLMYCRYISIAKDPNGTIVQQYNVTGVLTGPGILTAEADGVNPKTVTYVDYTDKLSTQTDIIGYDWKTLTGISWVLDQDKVFFVKTTDNHMWRLHFIDFEGSSTGTAVMEKTDLGLFSSSTDLVGVQTGIFPNPVDDQLILSLDITEDSGSDINIDITNVNGQVMVNRVVKNQQGLKVFEISTGDWNKGTYFVRISNSSKQFVSKKIVRL
ncbi:MAG: T9SS type A sorting domain-containing protein [Saprospiraceae bacterium]|nr:T9SS type A sorting domain-containing protein [Saprospiraceae bacterium]MBP6565554.1 T9SS type A sorting domain-containing protein [Saprospiraceae bacterium]